MADYHSTYRLRPKPIAIGGQAEVFYAEHRDTGEVVALKRRRLAGEAAADRMRREIQVQSVIKNPHVMPILLHDVDDYSWFTMPLADTTLADLQLPLDLGTLTTVIGEASAGLEAAHAQGFVHRDIKPTNILRLVEPSGARWVVADWGVVRKPEGFTTAQHTQTGVLLGTEGFAPPEAYSNPHAGDISWDSYSLGRIAAWASTGTWPTPLNDLPAPEPWRRFVRLLTDNNKAKRPQDMARVRELLSHVGNEPPAIAGVPNDVLAAAKKGDTVAAVTVLRAALDYREDASFFIDDVAEVSGPGLEQLVRESPDVARAILESMDHHLGTIEWGRRDFNHYNVPLLWMQRLADAAASIGDLDLLEDAAGALFRHEPGLDRYLQRDRSRNWIASLSGKPAARVARVLREHPEAASYYGPLKHATDAAIRAALPKEE